MICSELLKYFCNISKLEALSLPLHYTVHNFMRTGRNGESPAHFFVQLTTLSVKTIRNISTSPECKILMEEIRCYLLSAFIHRTTGPVVKHLMFRMSSD